METFVDAICGECPCWSLLDCPELSKAGYRGDTSDYSNVWIGSDVNLDRVEPTSRAMAALMDKDGSRHLGLLHKSKTNLKAVRIVWLICIYFHIHLAASVLLVRNTNSSFMRHNDPTCRKSTLAGCNAESFNKSARADCCARNSQQPCL